MVFGKMTHGTPIFTPKKFTTLLNSSTSRFVISSFAFCSGYSNTDCSSNWTQKMYGKFEGLNTINMQLTLEDFLAVIKKIEEFCHSKSGIYVGYENQQCYCECIECIHILSGIISWVNDEYESWSYAKDKCQICFQK